MMAAVESPRAMSGSASVAVGRKANWPLRQANVEKNDVAGLVQEERVEPVGADQALLDQQRPQPQSRAVWLGLEQPGEIGFRENFFLDQPRSEFLLQTVRPRGSQLPCFEMKLADFVPVGQLKGAGPAVAKNPLENPGHGARGKHAAEKISRSLRATHRRR